MPVPLIAAGVASLIARAAVSTAAKRALTAAAAKGLTKKQVAELVVRNEAKAAKALVEKGIKTGPKRYDYRGTGYSDPKLDAAFRASPGEGSVQAMAKRMLAESPEKAARIAEGKAKVVMARNRAQTVARVQKKKELTTSASKSVKPKDLSTRKRQAELAEQRSSNPVDAAKVTTRVRPPVGYSGAKVVKPVKRATKPVDTSVKVTKPTTKRTPEEVKAARDAAKERSIARNAPRKIAGKRSVTKPPVRSTATPLKQRPRTQEEMRRLRNAQEEMRKKDYKNKGRAERERDVDAEDVPQGITIRGKFYPEGTVGIGARSTRGNKTIVARSPKVRDDLPPKDELTAIRKAFAELTKEEKEAFRLAEERGIQGILREKIIKGPSRKPAGPKDAPKRNYITPERRIETIKARTRSRRAAEIARDKRLAELKKRLTPAQRKAIAEAIARAKRNSK